MFIITERKRLGRESVYIIKDLNDEQIEDSFYERELHRIQLPKEFRVEKVSRKKKQEKRLYFS